ncbi:hypothetical protein [Pontibacter sp. G13]|uniref:hypothetical protein n=1 Tax=Pontibacter sp. G13 TaxID=3074898 RepID=UPI00288B7ACC|nr:hypothetical protein [Pontibacter sp. G13]WNJ19926.1 hypothetical protein RJD25_05535 [Pontibacter sp. G13]
MSSSTKQPRLPIHSVAHFSPTEAYLLLEVGNCTYRGLVKYTFLDLVARGFLQPAFGASRLPEVEYLGAPESTSKLERVYLDAFDDAHPSLPLTSLLKQVDKKAKNKKKLLQRFFVSHRDYEHLFTSGGFYRFFGIVELSNEGYRAQKNVRSALKALSDQWLSELAEKRPSAAESIKPSAAFLCLTEEWERLSQVESAQSDSFPLRETLLELAKLERVFDEAFAIKHGMSD